VPGRDFTRAGEEFVLDSAVALYWDPRPLAPGESRRYITYYGLGGITIAPGHLSLGVTSPQRVEGSCTDPVVFEIRAYAANRRAWRWCRGGRRRPTPARARGRRGRSSGGGPPAPAVRAALSTGGPSRPAPWHPTGATARWPLSRLPSSVRGRVAWISRGWWTDV